MDFAGGATEEWMDSKKMKTQEGDILALVRIEQFLQRKVVDGESDNFLSDRYSFQESGQIHVGGN